MKLSIITVNLNNIEGLQRTINSVITQSFKEYEWIIIDGGSTDGSRELIEQYADCFAYWVSEPDKGIYNAMNKGVRMAKGEYIQFLNSGDWYWNDTVLEKAFSFHPTSEIAYADFNFVEDNIVKKTRRYPDILSLKEYLEHGICHNSSFFKKQILIDNPYNEDFFIASDIEIYIKAILENRSILHLPVVLIGYDITGISSNYLLGQKESRKIRESLISPNIQKDLDNLIFWESLPQNKVLKEVNYYRENSHFYHKMITGSIIFMRFIYRIFNKSKMYKNL